MTLVSEHTSQHAEASDVQTARRPIGVLIAGMPVFGPLALMGEPDLDAEREVEP